jgi:hypothetical protein
MCVCGVCVCLCVSVCVCVDQAVSTLDLVNIWSGTTEFSTHDTLFNVHTWIVYQRLQVNVCVCVCVCVRRGTGHRCPTL